MTKEDAFACGFGCVMAFIAEYSWWRHETFQTCSLQPTDININRCRCPDEIHSRCQNINDANKRLLPSDYNRHYEHEHGRRDCENNADAIKCRACMMGFVSKRLFVRHLIRSIRHTAKDPVHHRSPLPISRLMHYRSLAQEGLVWTISLKYVKIEDFDDQNLYNISLPFP